MRLTANTRSITPARDSNKPSSPTPRDPAEPAFQALIEAHLPLLRAIVERLKRKLPATAADTDELLSVGLTGLVAAARNYRAGRAGSFGAYAATRIRGALLDELRRRDWMGRTRRAQAKRLGATLARLEQQAGGAVAPEALGAELQLSPAALRALQEQLQPVRLVSLDGPEAAGPAEAEGEEGRSLHELIADDFAPSAPEALARKELRALLAARIAQLPEMPRKVLALYYYENLRLADIAAGFGLTESRICQIHTQALKQLRAYPQTVLA